MTFSAKLTLLLLRLSLGWIFLFSGWTKVMDPTWSAAGYLKAAKTLPLLFQWFASPENLVWVDLFNSWGQLFIGVALIAGFSVRSASLAGMLLMTLYYLPTLQFPMAGRSFLVDDHVMYFLVFLLLWKTNTGKFFGLQGVISKLPIIGKL
ncbi:MAG: DoxX family membrane protein [bacterium]|nr:DoxX family membrane protein [bacterium]